MASTGRQWRWGYVACAWAAAFAIVHLYWGLGGRAGLDVSAGPALASKRPAWFVVVGLFGVCAALLVGAAVAVLLERSWRWRRLLALLGWTASAILLLRGIGLELLMVTGAVHAGNGITGAQLRWTWLVWNPWFIVGGICFTMASIQFGRRVRDPAAGQVPQESLSCLPAGSLNEIDDRAAVSVRGMGGICGTLSVANSCDDSRSETRDGILVNCIIASQ